MCRCVIGLLVVAALWGTAAEAQTITGRIEPTWDAEKGLYTYGPLYWDLQVAPSSAGSDEFGLYVYYNKARQLMAVTLACRGEDEDFTTYARSFSGEHFLSLTAGLLPGEECVLFLVGGNDRAEELAYRMAVSERVTRPTDPRELSTAAARIGREYRAGSSAVSQIVSQTLRHLARALANARRE